MLTLALSLGLALQELPDKASLVYTGIPVCTSASSVQMVTHQANAQLSKLRVTVDSLTYLKNASTQPATITISIPVDGHNVDWNMSQTIGVSATLDNAPVALKDAGPQMAAPTDQHLVTSGVRAERYHDAFTFTVPFAGRGAHALRVHFMANLGHAGLDGAQRIIAYDVSGGSSWNGPVGELNFAVKYTPQLVFQVYAALPPNSWQVGATGAFIQQLNSHPSSGSKFIFTYYPGGYGKLGG